MKYRISISETNSDCSEAALLYEQTVESLDVRAVIEAVNSAPEPTAVRSRRAPRSDKGKKRNVEPVPTQP